MNRIWAAVVAFIGLLHVGVVYGCIWYAIPHTPIAREWPQFIPLLLGPYVMASLACWLSYGRFTCALAVFVVLAGLLIAFVAVLDAWPTFEGSPPPYMPASAIAAGLPLVGQYGAGVIALVAAVVCRFVPRAESTPNSSTRV